MVEDTGVRRVVGLETEFGIVVPGQPHADPMQASGAVVTAYARAHGHHAAHGAWDYSDEHPLLDARGFELPRHRADASQLTDEDDPTLANVVLGNGARLYVDHAHPEYSTPEVTTPRDAVLHDRAGELVMREAVARLAAQPPGINLYKNNTDGKGSSYGSHENYLMRRSTPFARIVRRLTPFLVARQVLCGAGRVGLGTESERAGYQIASRSDFFEAQVGLETTFRRPIINTRDEPHADADVHRRLHVIIGDATQCDIATLLKVGTTSLVLGLIEADVAGPALDALELLDPLAALRAISHDPTCRVRVPLRDGRSLTAIELLTAYLEIARDHHADQLGGHDEPTEEVLAHAERVLALLADEPRRAAADLDWVAKLVLLERYRERGGLDWSDPRLQAMDLQWSDVRSDKGLLHRLDAAGAITRLVSEEEVRAAVTTPPADTRAWLRGRVVAEHGSAVISASWDSVILRLPRSRRTARISMLDPLGHTAAEVGDLLDGDLEDLVDGLARR